ncbi:hypothetical protein BBJ28_00023463 [Nothophytophthora sp. Chile5]|nr:hypothetical protein BBJ28_00023463 [Nothophytophthora sp. Chile5]
MALALSYTSGQSTTTYTTPGSEDTGATAAVQPNSETGASEFVNEESATTTPTATSVPEEDFQNTALSAADESDIVGDVETAGSYASATTLSAATTTAESSNEDDSTNSDSAASTAPVILAAAAACVLAIAAFVVVRRRAMRASSPRTPTDKAIYYQVEVEVEKKEKKAGFFQVKRQLTPPV